MKTNNRQWIIGGLLTLVFLMAICISSCSFSSLPSILVGSPHPPPKVIPKVPTQALPQSPPKVLPVIYPKGPSIEWEKTFGGTDVDCANSVRQTSDNGYIIAGETISFGAESYDVYLIKTESDGNLFWAKTFGGDKDDRANFVRQTSDNGYIVAGETRSFGAGSYDVYLIKTDSSGNILWQKTFGGTDDDRANSVQQTSDNGYIIAGLTDSFGAGSYDAYLIKTDSSGNILWQKTFGGTNYDRANSIRQTSDNGYIIAGETASFGTGNFDAYLIKTDSSGNILWQKTFGGTNDDRADSSRQTSENRHNVAIDCGSKALFDFLSSKGRQVVERDIAVMALTVDTSNKVIKPEDTSKVIKSSMFALAKVSESFGCKLYPVKINLTSPSLNLLRSAAPFIAHFKSDHYVLVTKMVPGKIYYSDEHKEEFLPVDKFMEKFSGYALVSQVSDKEELISDELAKTIKGARDLGDERDTYAGCEYNDYQGNTQMVGISFMTDQIGFRQIDGFITTYTDPNTHTVTTIESRLKSTIYATYGENGHLEKVTYQGRDYKAIGDVPIEIAGRTIKNTTYNYYDSRGNIESTNSINQDNRDKLVSTSYKNQDSNAYTVQQTFDNGYIIAGRTYSFGAGKSDAYLIKTDSNGNLLWQKTFGGADDDCAYSVQQTSDSGYIIAGETTSFGAGKSDAYLIKTDSNGNLLWQKTIGGRDSDYAQSVQQTSENRYIVAGRTDSFGAGNFDVYLIKIAPE